MSTNTSRQIWQPGEWRVVKSRGKWALSNGSTKRSTGLAATPENNTAAKALANRKNEDAKRNSVGETIKEIVMAYLDDMPKRAKPITPSSAATSACANIVRYFGALKHDDVTKQMCRDYRDLRLGDGVTDATILTELKYLRAAIYDIIKRDHTTAQFDMPSAGQPRQQVLSDDQVRALMKDSYTNSNHIHVFLQLLWLTLARREAVLTMRWDTHIDLNRFEGKGGVWPGFKTGGKRRAEWVEMTPQARTAVLAAKERAISDYVVEWRGHPVRDVRTALHACYKRCGITGIKNPVHIFRHTGASRAAQKGVPMHIISRRLGHSSQAITERVYAHMHPDFKDQMNEALSI